MSRIVTDKTSVGKGHIYRSHRFSLTEALDDIDRFWQQGHWPGCSEHG
jgi:hypothetical protein